MPFPPLVTAPHVSVSSAAWTDATKRRVRACPREPPAASYYFKDPVISFYFEQKKTSCGNKQERPPAALADLPLAWAAEPWLCRLLGKHTLEDALVNLEDVAPIRPFSVLASQQTKINTRRLIKNRPPTPRPRAGRTCRSRLHR